MITCRLYLDADEALGALAALDQNIEELVPTNEQHIMLLENDDAVILLYAKRSSTGEIIDVALLVIDSILPEAVQILLFQQFKTVLDKGMDWATLNLNMLPDQQLVALN